MRDLSDLTLAGLTLTALMTFLTVEPPTSAPNRVSSALMGGGANIAYATAANHTTPAPIQANPPPATSPASRSEQRESKREGEVPAAVSPFTVPFPTPATIADIVEPAFEPMPSAREIVPTGQVDVRQADEQKASEQQTGGQAGAGSGFGDSRVPPLYDYDLMLAPRPATLLPDNTKAATEATSQDVDIAPPETAKFGDSRVPELAPMLVLPTNLKAEMAPAQASPITSEATLAAQVAPHVSAQGIVQASGQASAQMSGQVKSDGYSEVPPAKAAPCPKCSFRREYEKPGERFAWYKQQAEEDRRKKAEERRKQIAVAEAKRSAKSRDDGRPIEYVSMDGAAFPMLGSMSPFAKPLHVEDDIRSVKLRNAMSVAPQDPRWSGWVEQVRSQKEPMAMLRLADEIIDHNVAYRDGTQNIWRDVDWTLRAGGVCKDFAIAKLRLLTDAGFPEDALRIVSMTPRTPGHDYHVVVMAWLGGKTLVLDMNDKSGKGNVIPLGAFQGERGVVWSGNLQGAHEFSRRQAHQSDERRVLNVRETSGEEPGEKPATTASTETVVIDGKPLRVQRTPGDFVRYVAN